MLLTTAQKLIASPAGLLDEADRRSVPDLLVLTAISGVVIGAAAGLHHGGIQGIYSAVKMPFMLVIPTLLVLPALRGLAATLGFDLPLGRASIAAIAASARTAIFAAALIPAYWLFAAYAHSYAAAVFGLALTMGVGGMFGMPVLASCVRVAPIGGAPLGRPRPLRSAAFTLGAGTLFLLAAGQTGWHLRPFVRPPDAPARFFAPPEGDFYSNLKERFDRASSFPPVGQH